MSRDPDARFGSADEMAAALALETDPDATAPVAQTEPIERTMEVESTRAPAPVQLETMPEGAARSSRRLGAALVAALVVVLGAGIAWSHRSGSPSVPKSPSAQTTPTTLPPDLANAINHLQHAVDR